MTVNVAEVANRVCEHKRLVQRTEEGDGFFEVTSRGITRQPLFGVSQILECVHQLALAVLLPQAINTLEQMELILDLAYSERSSSMNARSRAIDRLGIAHRQEQVSASPLLDDKRLYC
jgi:hypothetical protein